MNRNLILTTMKNILLPCSVSRIQKLLALALLAVPAFVQLKAQLVVSTSPQPKNFLIEKGSGIACCSCPGITAKCDSIIYSYPKGKGYLMVYHFGPDARPQSGQLNKDYKTQFGDSILTPVWPFYLNMMVNRKDRGVPYGSTFVFGTTDQVSPECAAVVVETAPVNMAMSSSYNSTTREITVNVKAYYTANSATSKNYLQIALTEDSIIGPQCVGSSSFIYTYVHMDMFRANINGPIGVPVLTTTSGTTVTDTYKYTLPAKFGSGTDQTAWVTPNPNHLKLVMFITEDLNGTNTKFGKIQNVISAPLGAMVTSGIEDITLNSHLNIYPNPSNGRVQISSEYPVTSYELTDLSGRSIYKGSVINSTEVEADFSSVSKGLYMLKINTDKGNSVHKLFLQN